MGAFLLISLALGVVLGQASIPGTYPCPSGQYFNSNTLTCGTCPTNYEIGSDGQSCECPRTKTLAADGTCGDCTANQASSISDRTTCKPCANANCICPSNQINVEGAAAFTCVNCPTGSYGALAAVATNAEFECKTCPMKGQTFDGTNCVCPAGTSEQSTFCVNTAQWTTLQTTYSVETDMSYGDVETTSSSLGTSNVDNSDTLATLLPQALFECRNYKTQDQCQILANLCTYQMFDQGKAACKVLQDLQKEGAVTNTFYDQWKGGIPWLFYTASSADVYRNSDRLKATVSLSSASDPGDGKINYLNFKMAAYHLNGTFLGFEPLGAQLQLCDSSRDEAREYRRFGVTMKNKCEFDLTTLVGENKQANADVFYELFLEDANSDLIDVPVLVENLVGSGTSPNRASDVNNWVFVRRFFIFDTASSLVGANTYYTRSVNSTVLRWVDEAKLVVELDENNREQIYVPYLQIKYHAIQSADIEEKTSTSVKFESEYVGDLGTFWKVILWTFVALHFLGLALVVWKLYCWFVLYPIDGSGTGALFYGIVRFTFYVIETWSTLVYWFLFAACAFWFIFFKLQNNAHILMFTLDDAYYPTHLRRFDIVFGIMMGLKMIVFFLKIFFQAQVDFFIMDRERKKDVASTSTPNAWRHIFVANELNELQTQRYISVEITLLVYIYLMQAEGWAHWCNYDPAMNSKETGSPRSQILYFFFSICLLSVIGFVQFVGRHIFKCFLPLRSEDFVDLCSITNTSIFIFDQDLHGYYIHGESPLGQADISAKELKENLDHEGQGEAKIRGLLSEKPRLQTFEIFIPLKVRQQYELIYNQKAKNFLSNARSTQTAVQEGAKRKRLIDSLKAIPSGIDISTLIQQKDELTEYFISYIQQVKNYPQKYVQNRTAIQRLTGMPPANVNKLDSPLFLKDPGQNWVSIFFGKLDFDWIWIVAGAMTAFDIWDLHPAECALACYTYYKVIYEWPRKFLGTRNLAQKTLVENRFLM